MIEELWQLRLSGICGVAGALLLACGDVLYQHVPGSSAGVPRRMSMLSDRRLRVAAAMGLPATYLYLIGSWHVQIVLRPAGQLFGTIGWALFAAVMAGYGVAHTAYYSIATGARVAARSNRDPDDGANEGQRLFGLITRLVLLPAGIHTLMMGLAVLTGRTLYPMWMIVLLPGVLYGAKYLVRGLLRGRIGELVRDGFDNWVLFLYFAVSTMVVW